MKMLASLALMRGFMKPGGVPDHFRAAKLILKDLVQGKLLHCKPPPGVDQDTFCPMASCEAAEAGNEITNDMSLEESFPELRVQNGLHVR